MEFFWWIQFILRRKNGPKFKFIFITMVWNDLCTYPKCAEIESNKWINFRVSKNCKIIFVTWSVGKVFYFPVHNAMKLFDVRSFNNEMFNHYYYRYYSAQYLRHCILKLPRKIAPSMLLFFTVTLKQCGAVMCNIMNACVCWKFL